MKFVPTFIFILIFVSSVSALADTPYEITNFNNVVGSEFVELKGINNNGQVVGKYYGQTGQVTFIWDKNSGTQIIPWQGDIIGISDNGYVITSSTVRKNGSNINIGTLGGAETQINAISKSGKIAGKSQTASGQWNAFIWDQSAGMRNMGNINGDIIAVNDNDEIAGTFWASGMVMHSFLWNSSHGMIDIGESVGDCRARGLNSTGEVTGSFGGSIDRPFLWKDTDNDGISDPAEFQNLGTIGRVLGGSYGQAINDLEEVVGYFDTIDGLSTHGFIWDNEKGMIDLSSKLPQGWYLQQAMAINNSGQILGIAVNGDNYASVLLTPTPEPATLLLLGAGALMLKRKQ